MASGCIISPECPVCGEIVWEDEWDELNGSFIHSRCRKDFIKQTYHIGEEQFVRLMGAAQLRRDIKELRDCLRIDKRGYEEQIKYIAEQLEALKKARESETQNHK